MREFLPEDPAEVGDTVLDVECGDSFSGCDVGILHGRLVVACFFERVNELQRDIEGIPPQFMPGSLDRFPFNDVPQGPLKFLPEGLSLHPDQPSEYGRDSPSVIVSSVIFALYARISTPAL